MDYYMKQHIFFSRCLINKYIADEPDKFNCDFSSNSNWNDDDEEDKREKEKHKDDDAVKK